jgi:opacity protein-like surface antigen
MKKTLRILTISTLITSIITSDAYSKTTEKTGYYLRADLGTSSAFKLKDEDIYYNKVKVKRANVYDLGIGKYFSKNFRADLIASTQNYKLNNTAINQKLRSLALMINGYYDITTIGLFTPYLFAGVGIAKNKTGTLTANYKDGLSSSSTVLEKKSTNNLAWQIGAGSTIKLTNKIDLDLSYKFTDRGKIKTGPGFTSYSNNDIEAATPGNARLRTQEFLIGARYSF